MKSSILRRNDTTLEEPVQIAPSNTAFEHQQRVEEWTQKSTSAPPSNRKRSAKEQEAMDLDAKSQMIAEAVQILDYRDKQTRSRPATAGALPYDNESDDDGQTEESQYFSIGKHFRNSKLSARNYVKLFETKMKRKQAYKDAILNTYPPIKSKKDLAKAKSTMYDQGRSPVLEPDSWRYKASRSVKFAVKSSSQQTVPKPSDDASEDGEKWTTKHENDRDWWRWKIKQRFMQNDELLSKLATQRQKLEADMVQGEKHRINRATVFNNKKPITPEPTRPIYPTTARNSSWHVSVEIPSHMVQSSGLSNKRPSALKASQTKPREPMPNFYTPSKQVITAITVPLNKDPSMNAEILAQQKLKVLKKDPYLSKLLAGNEMFKPEIMLEDNQQNKKHQIQEYKHLDGGNPRRKLSLESLTDTDDELTATKFFNPDVKVLYERLSEMEMMNNGNLMDKSRFLAGGVRSKEPSDGFLNLPLLLETGRFNRYNKLPSIKLFTNKDLTSSKQQTKKSEKSTNKLQNAINKMKTSANLTNIKLVKSTLVGGATAATNISEGNPVSGGLPIKIEDLPTSEWARKLISKVKKQDNSTRMDNDGNVMEHATFPKKSDEINDILNVQQRKYKVPIDQETNLLYHEILMSKWKKDKHGKDKDADTGGKNKATTKVKRVEHGHDKQNVVDEKPRGLDIWLENIRERAKRDRVISPLPNNGEISKGLPSLSQFDKSTFKMMEVNK